MKISTKEKNDKKRMFDIIVIYNAYVVWFVPSTVCNGIHRQDKNTTATKFGAPLESQFS